MKHLVRNPTMEIKIGITRRKQVMAYDLKYVISACLTEEYDKNV